MKPIKYSEAFMAKFGHLIHRSMDDMWSRNVIRYRLDWRYKAHVDLQKWLNDQMSNEIIQGIAARFMNLPSNDAKVLEILRWVKSHVVYIRDIKVWYVKEKWQTAIETYQKATGDCEDGAVLILILARMVGVPSNQIKLNAGSVEGGGHAWIEYRADYDGMRRYIDWCYWYDSRTFRIRPWAHALHKYFSVWWSVNDVRGYGIFKRRGWP